MTKRRRLSPAARINKLKAFFLGLVRYALIICLAFMILAPILKNISVAFTNPRDLNIASALWIPNRVSIENWHVSAMMMDYGKALPYTFLFTAILMVLQTTSAMMAGYSFARLKFPGRGFFFAIVVLTIIVPPQVFMLPQYLYFKSFDLFGLVRLINGKPLNLLNSPYSLLVLNLFGMGLKSGLYIYIFRQTFRGLPKELEEAAYIDGAGFLRTFFSVVLPTAGAGILTVAVLSFVWNWNDSYYTSLFDGANLKHLMLAFNLATASVDQALAKISSKVPVGYAFILKSPIYEGAIAKTASLLVFLPLVALYLLVQKRFVQGVERSGIVG